MTEVGRARFSGRIRGTINQSTGTTDAGRVLLEWIGWLRAIVAVAARPGLWFVGSRQIVRMARPRWWRRAPFLPLPEREYLRFRLETAYGRRVAPRPADVVSYLRWCRDFE